MCQEARFNLLKRVKGGIKRSVILIIYWDQKPGQANSDRFLDQGGRERHRI